MVQSMMTKSEYGEEVEEYLKIKRKATRFVYSSAFRLFLNFYQNKHGKGKGFSHFLDRIFAEIQKPRREQKRVAEIELVDFINYLKELGKSNNTIRLYFAAVQNFLKYKQVMVSARFINLPPPVEKPSNHKHEWTIEEIKSFIDSAPTFRDKAVIACLFQSGLGINELVNLNYSDIEEEFEKRIIPICLKLVRQHLLQYMVWLEDRGEGTVYKLSPSHFTDETYTKFLCRIRFEMLDVNECEKMWCYSCKSFKDSSCNLLRAQYEHKREQIQNQRYKQDLDKSQKEEGRKIPFEQWLARAYEHYEDFWYTNPKGLQKISTEKICLILGCSHSMAQRIRSTLNQMTKEEVLELIGKRFGIR